MTQPIPPNATLASICANIRGGALERVDFHNAENRTCVGLFFISAEEAMRYIKYSRSFGGVYWAGTGVVSAVSFLPASPLPLPLPLSFLTSRSGLLVVARDGRRVELGPAPRANDNNNDNKQVDAIPRGKGGHEPIKPNVSLGIRSGATRVLRIGGLPNNISLDQLRRQIRKQSSSVTAEIESVVLVPESSAVNPSYTGFVRMATIGTALGARLRLAGLKFYRNCAFDFMPGPAPVPLCRFPFPPFPLSPFSPISPFRFFPFLVAVWRRWGRIGGEWGEVLTNIRSV